MRDLTDARTAPALSVRRVTVRDSSRTLLHSVGLDIIAGTIVVVIGPNGAGKTTLLEAIAGLRRTDSGQVSFDGKSLRTFSERARTFSYLPDAADLPPELDVRAVVGHALRFEKRSKELLDELGRAVDLAALLDKPCGLLSRGERQRVQVYCALALERPVVLLDEPFSAFDPVRVRTVLPTVRRIADGGAAIVASVHQLADAEKIADQLVLLSDGCLLAQGNFSELRREADLLDGSLEDVFIEILRRSQRAA